MIFENISFQCVKGIPKSDVERRKLSDMGFPVDVPDQPDMSENLDFVHYASKIFDSPFPVEGSLGKFYINTLIETKSRDKAFELVLQVLSPVSITASELKAGLQSSCLYELEAEEAEVLIEEFVFIINELIPRQITDVYDSFDIEPNPAYCVFFDLADKRLKLEKYNNQSVPWHGQFVSHAEDGVRQRFLAGESLLSIYGSTCATKTLIKDALLYVPHSVYDSIELILFSLSKQYGYKRIESKGETLAGFEIYQNGDKVLNIVFLPKEELDLIEDFEKYLSELYLDEYPILVIAQTLRSREGLSSLIRKVLKNPAYIKTYHEHIIQCFRYEKIIKSSSQIYKFAETAKLCGCFNCGEIFPPSKIKEWYFCEDEENGAYTYCPMCGDDTIIMDSQGYEITEEFMGELMDYYEERDFY